MILDINVYNIVYTTIFLLSFVLAYFVVLCSNFEKLFKQGYIWAIRLGQILLALVIAYLVTSGVMLLVNSTQFSIK